MWVLVFSFHKNLNYDFGIQFRRNLRIQKSEFKWIFSNGTFFLQGLIQNFNVKLIVIVVLGYFGTYL